MSDAMTVDDLLSRSDALGSRPGLEAVSELLLRLGDPHLRIPCIHIAGTNGKGSTATYIASALEAAGHCCGLFTSPPLRDREEQVRVSMKPVRRETLDSALMRCANAANGMDPMPTTFELTFAAACLIFEEFCDIAVIETGMGGALDATNPVMPEVSVITSISLDHQDWLGETLAEIAAHKCGIIKAGVPCVASKGLCLDIIKGFCNKNASALIVPEEYRVIERTACGQSFEYRGATYSLKCPATYSPANAVLAIEALHLLNVPGEAVRSGLERAEWSGRFQIVDADCGGGTIKVILDGAHNPAGADRLADSLKALFPDKSVRFVFGVMRDKPVESMLRTLIPLASSFSVVNRPAGDRAMDGSSISAVIKSINPEMPVFIGETLGAAIDAAIDGASADCVVCVAGTLYQLGEAMELLGLVDQNIF